MEEPGAGPPDERLVAAVRRGDARAADALVRRHYRAVYLVTLAVLGNAADAEDACQDALVRALERIDDCRDPRRFAHWLLQIARNRARNARDYRGLRRGPSLDEVEHPATGDATGDAERGELRERLTAALATLTPEQRQVVLLKDLEGWDHRAIARSMGISETMSRQHAFVARRALRRALGDSAEGLDE